MAPVTPTHAAPDAATPPPPPRFPFSFFMKYFTLRKVRDVATVALLAFMYLLVGGLVYSQTEPGWSSVDAVYFSVVTMSTVGYGDLSPTSSLGKLVTMFSTLMGIIFVAMPLTIVGDNFSEAWQNRKLQFILDQIRDQLHVRSVQDCVVAFETFDASQDGWIDWVKFKAGVRK